MVRIREGNVAGMPCIIKWLRCRSRPSHQHQHIINMDTQYSTRVSGGTRIYYFDVHTDKKGSPYITITEVPTEKNPARKERQRVFIHREDFDKFAAAFAEVTNFINSSSQ